MKNEMNAKHNTTMTKEAIMALRPGGLLSQRCSSVAAFQSTLRNAYAVKKNNPRGDGYEYRITSDSIAATVSVSLVRKEDRP